MAILSAKTDLPPYSDDGVIVHDHKSSQKAMISPAPSYETVDHDEKHAFVDEKKAVVTHSKANEERNIIKPSPKLPPCPDGQHDFSIAPRCRAIMVGVFVTNPAAGLIIMCMRKCHLCGQRRAKCRQW